ncbi:MAG: hypothetical protein A2017_04345 [Lentisphaerae bacterium GWF2_44_16]|nr:MAG: hypothetical protein A2017_04345 [Lentisphaerae bacterium GWF2_44_16]
MDKFKKNGIPKYIQFKEVLIEEIRNGYYNAGDKFHSEKELMGKYGLSYPTVMHTLRDMAKEGFFVRRKGQGTFVTEYALNTCRPEKIESGPLYISGKSFGADSVSMPFAWFVFDEMKKGIINSYNGPVKIVSLDEILSNPRMNAIILTPEKDEMEKIQNSRNKYIIINHRREVSLDFNSVTREMIMGVYELMSYLIKELGHRKIAYIGGNRMEYHADRYAGYEIGLRAYGIAHNENFVIRSLLLGREDGYKAMKKLLSLKERPTAVFADTDIKAYGVIDAIREAGLRVPEDISVAGFDDIPGSDTFEPPLTTVKIPYYGIGQKAVEMLLKRITENRDIRTEVMKSSLAVRKSCSKVNEN